MTWTKKYPVKEGFYIVLYNNKPKAEQFHNIDGEIIGKRGNKKDYKEYNCLFTSEPYEPPHEIIRTLLFE